MSIIGAQPIPEKFIFPHEYIDFMNSPNTIKEVEEPWRLLNGDEYRTYYKLLLPVFEGQTIPIPFALMKDEISDSHIYLAFFDGTDLSGNPAIFVHDMGQSREYIEWGKYNRFSTFENWLKSVKKTAENYRATKAEIAAIDGDE